MIEVVSELLKTAFFLQGSYVLTYIPLMTIIMTLIMRWRSSLPWMTSILIVLQCVLGSYLFIFLLSVMVGIIFTYLHLPLISHGLKEPQHYMIAVLLSVAIYAVVQIAFLSVQKKNSDVNIPLLVVLCNLATAGIMIGLNVFLFIRHL